jgi:exonuclease SbcC
VIHQLTLSNFQSHAESVLDFHPGVNVIIGPSDSGKTAIIRALRWIAENQPGGDGYRRHDTKTTKAALTVEGPDAAPHTVTRAREGKRGNAYHISTSPDPYKALGKGGVPDDIKALLDLGPINLQHQHDPPFLLSSNAGEVGRILNQIVRLEEMDHAISGANARVQRHKLDVTTHSNELLTLEAGIEDLAYVDDMEADLVALEALVQDYNQAFRRAGILHNLLDDLVERERAVLELAPFVAMGYDLKELEVLHEIRRETGARIDAFGTAIRNLEAALSTKERVSHILAMGPDLTEMEALQDELATLTRRGVALRTLIFDLEDANHQVALQANAITVARATLTAAVPETCPTCGQPWPKEEPT